MKTIETSHLPLIEVGESTGRVREVFEDIKQTLQVPFVPNLFRSLATSPGLLTGTWEAYKSIYLETTLPMSLKAMLLYSISYSRDCEYCSAVHHVTCRTVGVDESTLEILTQNLEGLTPSRVQSIIRFGMKCGDDPRSLDESDYSSLRDQGVTDEEIMEIIGLASLGVYLDLLADAIKTRVDDVFVDALSS